MPPTATMSPGWIAGASARISRTRALTASRSASVGGSPRTRSRVRRAAPSGSPAACTSPAALTTTNSELPPPMSTTSRLVSIGRPLVTPRSVSRPSSSWSMTCSATPGARLDRRDDRRRVVRAPQGLGAHDRDPLRTELAGGVGIGDERGHELLAGIGCPDAAVGGDPVAEAQEHGLVEERLHAVATDRRDEQMDAGRADVDGGPDDGPGRDLDRDRRGLGGLGGLRLGLGLGLGLDGLGLGLAARRPSGSGRRARRARARRARARRLRLGLRLGLGLDGSGSTGSGSGSGSG